VQDRGGDGEKRVCGIVLKITTSWQNITGKAMLGNGVDGACQCGLGNLNSWIFDVDVDELGCVLGS
jgi:hypothetical protein